MKQFIRNVLVAAAPVYGTCISIAIVQGARLPFPPALSAEALPQWAIFCSVVYTSTALCMFVANRLFGQQSPPGASKAVA